MRELLTNEIQNCRKNIHCLGLNLRFIPVAFWDIFHDPKSLDCFCGLLQLLREFFSTLGIDLDCLTHRLALCNTLLENITLNKISKAAQTVP
jgi:hypothetical protein